MTREEMEADIALLESASYNGSLAKHQRLAIERAIARLRADLARMEGPPEGMRRLRIGVDRASSATGVSVYPVDDTYAPIDEHTIAVITVDIPIPRVVEVEGVVEEVKP